MDGGGDEAEEEGADSKDEHTARGRNMSKESPGSGSMNGSGVAKPSTPNATRMSGRGSAMNFDRIEDDGGAGEASRCREGRGRRGTGWRGWEDLRDAGGDDSM